MALLSLKTFVSFFLQERLPDWLLDKEVLDPLLEERLLRIRAQLTAALALREILQDLEIRRHDGSRAAYIEEMDLNRLAREAFTTGLIHKSEMNCLLHINKEANEAKHMFAFRSSL